MHPVMNPHHGRRQPARPVARHRPLLIALALFGLAADLTAQGHRLSFDHLSVEQGLSQASVRTILQDRRGFLWIATQDGLNRYDGYRFKVYKQDADDPGSLRGNTVYALLEDRAGVLWAGTWGGGLNRYHRATDTFTALRHDPGDPTSLGHDIVRALHEDRAGTLWVGTDGGGLNRFDPDPPADASGSFTRYLHQPDNPASLGSNSVRAIYEDRAGTLWVGTREGGLSRLRADGTFTTYRHDPADPASLGGDTAYAVTEDRAGNFWVGTFGGGLSRFDRANESFTTYRHDPAEPASLGSDLVYSVHAAADAVLWVGTRGGGLSRLDVETGEFHHFRHDPRNPRSLASDLVTSIYEDPTGTLWLGTAGGGVAKLDFQAQKFAHYRHYPDDAASLGNDSVLALLEDRSGVLWVGTWGGGLDRFDRRTGVFTHFRHQPDRPEGLGSDAVYALCEDRAGALWVGTEDGGLQRFEGEETFVSYRHDAEDPRSLSEDSVASLHLGRDGTLWVGTWDHGLNRYDRPTDSFTRYVHDPADPTSLSGHRVYAIHEDRQGTLWVSAEAHGLNALDRGTGTFTHYLHDEDDPTSLSNNDVMVIYEDRSGTLWVGTYGAGLNRLDRASGSFQRYDERQGLPNNVVYGILEDDLGRLWLSTNKGLSRFDPRSESFRNYDVHDGLQSQEFNSGAYHQSPRGVFYFGGNAGFNAFVPERVTDNPYVPPVVLTSFKKLNEEVLLDTAITEIEAITLEPEDDVISFGFAALSYTAPLKNRYATMLEGFNDDWIELGTKRDITFTSLDPGSYVFRVKGSNNDGVWNEEGVALELTVLPPWWATWWFRTLSVLGLALAVAAVYQIRTRSVRARNRLLEGMNRELEGMNHELEAKNEELERFTYTVSHDLKAPLVTVKGFLGLLQRDALAGNRERMEQDIARINGAADKMARLLEELLELSRIGRMMNPPEPVSLTGLAREAASLVAARIEERGVDLDIDPGMPEVVGDRTRLLEVLQNLLDNAVAFLGDQPRPRIEIGAREAREEVRCWVRDNGVGIDPEYHRKVFGLFERLQAETPGTGIGLALVERIVTVHGGRVWVESEGRGQGSTFFFTLPRG